MNKILLIPWVEDLLASKGNHLLIQPKTISQALKMEKYIIIINYSLSRLLKIAPNINKQMKRKLIGKGKILSQPS